LDCPIGNAVTARFTAVVEGGRLRPTVPLGLTEGQSVEVFILAPETADDQSQSAAEILAAIAALPAEAADPLTSVRHDEVLYSREAHP
jgi:hypothetical protein